MTMTKQLTDNAAPLNQPRARPLITLVAFWTGAVADAVMAVAMLHPSFWGKLLKIDNFDPSLRYQVDMGIGAALMLGWSALLIWGACKPVERRGVLLLTAFPVVTGILLVTISAVTTGLATAASLTTVLVFLPLLIALLVVGYVAARRAASMRN